MVRATAKVGDFTFIDFYIPYRTASLRILYFQTLTYIFQGHKFETLIFRKAARASTEMCQLTFEDVAILRKMASFPT